MTNTQTTHFNPGTTKLFALFVKGEFYRIVPEDDHGLCEFMHRIGFERVANQAGSMVVWMDQESPVKTAIALGSPKPFTVNEFLSYADKKGAYDNLT